MSQQTSEDLSYRNLLRMRILEIADALDAGERDPAAAASELRAIADADIREMDESDIEIDFDTGGMSLGPLMAIGPGKARGAPAAKDPVEAALSKVIHLRDRKNGLLIIGDAPGQADIDAYREALGELRKALLSSTPGK